jgi:hypothetical protein
MTKDEATQQCAKLITKAAEYRVRADQSKQLAKGLVVGWLIAYAFETGAAQGFGLAMVVCVFVSFVNAVAARMAVTEAAETWSGHYEQRHTRHYV